MLEFFITVPKGSLTKYNGIQPPLNTRINLILRLCMPENAHT